MLSQSIPDLSAGLGLSHTEVSCLRCGSSWFIVLRLHGLHLMVAFIPILHGLLSTGRTYPSLIINSYKYLPRLLCTLLCETDLNTNVFQRHAMNEKTVPSRSTTVLCEARRQTGK